jgi:hypothetical protein
VRITGSVTALSWIPSEAVTGLARLPFDTGVAHYDVPPPDDIGPDGDQLEELQAADRFRFANRLAAWIEVDDEGAVVGAGYGGGGLIGATTLLRGLGGVTVAAVALPDKQAPPEISGDAVRFVQTAGGRTGVPTPRTVRRPPFVQYHAPIAWSTLALTIRADGRVHGELTGASPFPRHWVYDQAGHLAAKTGLVDYRTWYQDAFGNHTPWGDLDSPALVTAIETALERELSGAILRGGPRPSIRRLRAGDLLVRQGEAGDELFLVLDGVLALDVDGRELAAFGPGTVLGERAVLEDGRRTATLRAVTACKVAAAAAATIDREALAQLALGHARERQGS